MKDFFSKLDRNNKERRGEGTVFVKFDLQFFFGCGILSLGIGLDLSQHSKDLDNRVF